MEHSAALREKSSGCAAPEVKRVSFHTFPTGWPYSPISWIKARSVRYRIDYSNALMQGMQRHGINCAIGKRKTPSTADLAVLWSWRQPKISEAMLASGRHVLVLERGFIQPRMQWVSLAIDGFNNRGRFAPAKDGGARWYRHFSHHLRPWRKSGGDYALLIGQVPGDTALDGVDIVSWAQTQTGRLVSRGLSVVYRPHPLYPTPCPYGAILSQSSLADDLNHADRVVAYSSTTAVESILAGIPTVVYSPGSVAYPMCSHDIGDPIIFPDRTEWCHDLAWRQFSIDELKSGLAWEHVKNALVPF